MERMDVNEFVEDAFAEEMILKTERRMRKRKQIRQICVVLVVLLTAISVFGKEEITSAAENTIFYLFGKSGQDNIQDTAFYALKEPLTIGDKQVNQIEIAYAFLIEDQLTMRLQMHPGHWNDVDQMALLCGGQRCAVPQMRARANVLGDGHDVTDTNQFEQEGDIFLEYVAYDQQESVIELVFSRVKSRNLSIEYAGAEYQLPLVPASGYSEDSLFTAKTDDYKVTAILLDRDKAAVGVHIDTLKRFKNWQVYLKDVHFVGEGGKRIDSTYYYDDQSYMPIENVWPEQLYVGGICLEMWGNEMQNAEENRYVIKVPEQGTSITLNQKLNIEGADATLEEVTRKEDRLRLRFSCKSNYGMLSNILLALKEPDQFQFWQMQGEYYSTKDKRTYSDLSEVQEDDIPYFYVDILIGQGEEELSPEWLEEEQLQLSVESLSIQLQEAVTLDVPKQTSN